ncbi:MAG: hypothetical protein RLZZ398_2091 [Verrucomicrobiota bacterium]|jgi:hypothetical protein
MNALLFLSPLLANWSTFLVLFGFYILFKILASRRIKGRIGEAVVKRTVLDRLDPALYRHFHDLYLPRPDGQGSTQVDHVIVSPFGIFVIETKNYNGWIFGSETQRQWTQQIYRTKHRFQNPLHQNHLHVKALIQFLGLREKAFHSLVYFIGGAEFKTPMPGNVLNHGLLSWIKKHSTPLLNFDAIQIATSLLESLNQSTDRKTAARDHSKALAARNA